ncbi:Protein TPX2 [Zea mays]|uniref:Protein TPX2 n=1 Tax=Zea mays TaxID=4577 RepID=A0A3L6FL41_MAIZE|nr:Protein TPX2 [Zea mays]
MMTAAATRARRQPRRPFAPVVVSPPSQAENRLVHEDAPSSVARPVRRFGTCAGKIAGPAVNMKCSYGSSPVCTSSKKTPAAVKRAPGTATRRLDSCAMNKKRSTPAAYDAPREPASRAAEERDDMLPCPCSEAGRERRGSEASASRKRGMTRVVAMEEAMAGIPEPGEGRVKYLVDTFERLLSLGGGPTVWDRGAAAARRRRKNQGTAAATASSPATPQGAEEIDVSHPSIASSSEVSFPAIAGVACILDASDRTSMISRARGQRRKRAYYSTGPPSDRAWSCSRKVTRVTTQLPFRLRTEQRGKAKEGNFFERLRKMQVEEERLRNPLAQGLPYTTEEPEIPAKPPTREPTEPIDRVLHSEARVVRRVKFDSQVAERSSFMEEVKLERERQQKADEEVEIKQMRKQQVPRAHPMPDFSKPFVPKRSVKLPTVPREPRFQPRLPW